MFRIFLFLLSIPTFANAQSHCVQALIQDKGELNINDATSLALASSYRRTLDKESDWAGNITVPIKGVPVGASANSANSTLESLTSTFESNFSSQRILSYATQTLSRQSVEAYKACISGASQHGVTIFAYDATPSEVTVEIRWNAPPDAPTTAGADINAVNAVTVSKFPDSMVTGQSFSTVLRRNRGADIRIVANVGGFSANETVFWIPSVSVNTERQEMSFDGPHSGGRWRFANDGSGRAVGPVEECRFAPDGWTIVPNSASINISARVGHIDDRTYARISEETSRKVCFEARMYPLSKEGGGDLWFRPTYLIERTTVSID